MKQTPGGFSIGQMGRPGNGGIRGSDLLYQNTAGVIPEEAESRRLFLHPALDVLVVAVRRRRRVIARQFRADEELRTVPQAGNADRRVNFYSCNCRHEKSFLGTARFA